MRSDAFLSELVRFGGGVDINWFAPKGEQIKVQGVFLSQEEFARWTELQKQWTDEHFTFDPEMNKWYSREGATFD